MTGPDAAPPDPESLRRAAAARAAARDWTGAAALLQQAAQREPGDAATWYALAKALEHGGEPRRSHAAVLRALVAGPARWPHALALARMLRAWNETEGLRALSRSMMRWRDAAPLAEIVELADLLGREDLHEDALAWVDAALAREPDHVPARYVRGSTQLFLGRMDAARADLEHAVAREPTYAQAHWRLAEMRDGDVGSPGTELEFAL